MSKPELGARLMTSSAHTTSESDQDALAWLIDPVTRQEFQQNFYERQLCLVTRTSPSHYAGLLGAEDLDTVLGTHNITHTEVKLVQGEKDVPQGAYTYASGFAECWDRSSLPVDSYQEQANFL